MTGTLNKWGPGTRPWSRMLEGKRRRPQALEAVLRFSRANAKLLLLALLLTSATPPVYAQLAHYTVTGDSITAPLDAKTGDATRGRALVRDRQIGNCLICHTAPEPDERFMGNLAPDLKGVGGRLTSGQMRLRLVDQSLINPNTIMPPYYRTDNLTRVAQRFRGQPGLTAQQIEDIVAFLATLKE